MGNAVLMPPVVSRKPPIRMPLGDTPCQGPAHNAGVGLVDRGAARGPALGVDPAPQSTGGRQVCGRHTSSVRNMSN